MLLNDAACSDLYAHETKKRQGLGILDPQMLSGFLGESLKTEFFSSQSLQLHIKLEPTGAKAICAHVKQLYTKDSC